MDPRLRFFPGGGSSGSNVRISQDPHIHLSFPLHPPARHLYPFSLLRLAEFPLIVIGISASDGDESRKTNGDIGEASASVMTPTDATFGNDAMRKSRLDPTTAFDDALRSLFPDSSPFPLVKRLVMVPSQPPRNTSPTGALGRKNQMWDSPNSIKGKERKGEGDVRWALAERADEWIAGLIGEVIGDVIGELGELVR